MHCIKQMNYFSIFIEGKPTILYGINFQSSWNLINALMTSMKHKEITTITIKYHKHIAIKIIILNNNTYMIHNQFVYLDNFYYIPPSIVGVSFFILLF